MTVIIAEKLPSGKLLLAADKRIMEDYSYSDSFNKIIYKQYKEGEVVGAVAGEQRAYSLAGDIGLLQYLISEVEDSRIGLNGHLYLDWAVANTTVRGAPLVDISGAILVIARKYKIEKKIYRELITVEGRTDSHGNKIADWIIYSVDMLPFTTGCGDQSFLGAYEILKAIQSAAISHSTDSELDPIIEDDISCINLIKLALDKAANVNNGISKELDYVIL